MNSMNLSQNPKAKKSKTSKNTKNINFKNVELNQNVTENTTFKKEESRSRKLEHTKIETLNVEEHHSEADEEDPEAQELKVLINQIPGYNDELMSFTTNLKLEE